MNETAKGAVSHRIANLALGARRRLEVERQRELDEGLTRRHLDNAEYDRRYLAAQFARLLRTAMRES